MLNMSPKVDFLKSLTGFVLNVCGGIAGKRAAFMCLKIDRNRTINGCIY